MIYRSYCECKQPEREELEKGLEVCLKCREQILNTQDEPEPDMSTCDDLVSVDNAGYESDRYETQTMERDIAR